MRFIACAAVAAVVVSAVPAEARVVRPAFAAGRTVGSRFVAHASGLHGRAFAGGRRLGFRRGLGYAGLGLGAGYALGYGAGYGGYGFEGGGYDDPFADQENGLPPGYESNPSNYPPPRAVTDGAYGSGAYHPTSYGFTTHEAEGMPDQSWHCVPYSGSRPGVRRVCEQ